MKGSMHSVTDQLFSALVGTGGVLIKASPGHRLQVIEVPIHPIQVEKPTPPDPRGRPSIPLSDQAQ